MSDEFKRFVKANEIKHVTSAPYHPSTNEHVERAVQIVKRGLQCIQSTSIQAKLSKFLFMYWITPYSTTGVASFEFLIG